MKLGTGIILTYIKILSFLTSERDRCLPGIMGTLGLLICSVNLYKNTSNDMENPVITTRNLCIQWMFVHPCYLTCNCKVKCFVWHIVTLTYQTWSSLTSVYTSYRNSRGLSLYRAKNNSQKQLWAVIDWWSTEYRCLHSTEEEHRTLKHTQSLTWYNSPIGKIWGQVRNSNSVALDYLQRYYRQAKDQDV